MDIHEALQRASQAAGAGDVSALEKVLQDVPAVTEARDSEGDTLLGLACRSTTADLALPPSRGTAAQHEAIDRILLAGADPSAEAENGWTPLHTAAMTGHVELARRLLAAGAARDGRLLGCDGGSPVALALFYAQTKIAEVLAAPPIPDNLRTAAGLGRPIERFLVGKQLTAQASAGTDFYRPFPAFPEWDRSCDRQELLDEALCWAARNDQLESMAVLVALGANVNANPYRGTPLLWATYGDRVAAAAWLLDHGADPNLRHDFGGQGHGVQAVAMHLAAQFGGLKCLRLLLERDADATIKDAANQATPLQWAEYAGANEAADLIRAHPC